MKTVFISELQSKTINSLIDENIRFTISHEEEDVREEEKDKNVSDKVALLREEFLRGSK